jgi:hypothetical protein
MSGSPCLQDACKSLQAWLDAEPDSRLTSELRTLNAHLKALFAFRERAFDPSMAWVWAGCYERFTDAFERLRDRLLVARLPLDARIGAQLDRALGLIDAQMEALSACAFYIPSKEEAAPLIEAAHHLHFMALLLSSMGARSLPPRFWKRAHRLARGFGTDQAIGYRASLALASLRPQSLGRRELVWLEACLPEQALRMQFQFGVREMSTPNQTTLCIDPETELPFLVEPHIRPGVFLVSTEPLGDWANKAQHPGEEETNLPEGLEGFEREALLERMAAYWLNPPRRRLVRNRVASDQKVDVLLGLPSIVQGLVRGSTTPLQKWHVRNKSESGYALFAVEGVDGELHAGDCLALRPPLEVDWKIATVRWIHSPGSGEAELGLQVLAHRARPTYLYFPDSQTPGERVPALMLSRLANNENPEEGLLLARTGSANVGRILMEDPDFPGESVGARAMVPTLRTARIELFRYRLLD